MAHMPEIKAEINKEPEKEKKKGGFLPRLFGGGTGAGAVGAGGFGGAAGGGLLATKAGLLALILVGTTVAGGIGLVGYKLFGPGSDSGDGQNLQLFAAKPASGGASSSDAQGAGSKDGSSQSLNMFSQANTPPKEPDVKPAEAPTDAAAASAAAGGADAAAAKGGKGPINAGDTASSGVSKGLLKNRANFGELSKGVGGGGGGPVVSAAGNKSAAGDALAQAAKNGGAAGMKRGPGTAGGSSSRAVAKRGSNGALHQAMGALADNRGATTSYGAGHTYDGSAAPAAGNIGPTGGDIGMGGPGDTTAAQPKSLPNTASDTKDFKAPPTPTAVDAAPWQNAINTAKMMLMAAAVIMLLAFALKGQPWFRHIKMALAAIVLMMGLAIIGMGAQIANGPFGQKAQGGVLAAAGLGLTIMAAAMMMDGDKKPTFDGENMDGADASSGASGSSGGSSGASSGSHVSGGLMGMNPLVVVGGGMALMGLIGSEMMPLQKYPSQTFANYANGQPPDTSFFGK